MGRNRRVKLFSEISGIEEIVGDDGRDWYGRLEERDFVEWIMSQLDEEGKEYLRYFLDGYTTKEVAQLWNWSDKKMSSWARRFWRRLKMLVRGYLRELPERWLKYANGLGRRDLSGGHVSERVFLGDTGRIYLPSGDNFWMW